MTPPDTIQFTQVDRSDRIRKVYNRIPELADAIHDEGMIQPVVLVPLDQDHAIIRTCPHCRGAGCDNCCNGSIADLAFGLDAGGRRCAALELLLSEGRWDGVLHHAMTSKAGFPGYVLKGIDESTPLKRLITEIGENLNREDMDWREYMTAIVKAYRLAKADANQKGQDVLMRDFGYILGCGYADLQAAAYIHDDVIEHPENYLGVTSVRAAYQACLKSAARHITRVQVEKTLAVKPVVQVQSEPKLIEEGAPPPLPPKVVPSINLSNSFKNVNSYDFMAELPAQSFDHIYTDPDYGVSTDRLNSNSDVMHTGVAQATIEDSFSELKQLIAHAARLIKPQGFFVFWYDLDYHNALQIAAQAAGFAVQRWPLIWHKIDARSNAAPAHNFPKNFEYAMVCRKPSACLSRAQTTSIFPFASAGVQKEYNHPFAKPLALHKWILSAIAIQGQTIYDPFFGSATIPCAVAEFGCKPVGTETNTDHYSTGIMNLQAMYRKLLNTQEVNFS